MNVLLLNSGRGEFGFRIFFFFLLQNSCTFLHFCCFLFPMQRGQSISVFSVLFFSSYRWCQSFWIILFSREKVEGRMKVVRRGDGRVRLIKYEEVFFVYALYSLIREIYTKVSLVTPFREMCNFRHLQLSVGDLALKDVSSLFWKLLVDCNRGLLGGKKEESVGNFR